ncbi:GUN4 domain-containing protein [Argonema antarcticum]|uniref:GUN4 domain-containing protein n=1 Tax=Argonema antarcticum TaxID=2942763 RepID=UPI002012A4E0|nr:GUN4 domain-containing protein [Argonema antarcticum]MCL1474109.1 GUN4 domain-containing protein [Argonema antarcticum A004/B2]
MPNAERLTTATILTGTRFFWWAMQLLDVDANYTRLRDLLAAGKLKEADDETRSVMLKVAGREHEGWLNEDGMSKLSCADLRTVDRLWVEYSKGRFGFSVQKRIYYEEMGKDWEKMGDIVGWRVKGEWLSISSLNYSSDAPTGHLPGCGAWVASLVWGLWSRSADNFYTRLDICNL